MNSFYTLRFQAVNQDIFEAIRRGRKKIETRSATPRYRKITARDIVEFVCRGERFEKKIRGVEFFSSVSALLRKYNVREINPAVSSRKELAKMYHAFPHYREKIRKFGLVALKM
jgi:ASC-1-like (ASCH) protein